MIDITDLRPTIVPKSDQLNSEQLLGGPMTITVTDVRSGSGEDQPVSIHYANDAGRPFKPCKTMRKVLILAWGHDARGWIGKSMTLFNEPSVKFGGMEVGGIRISHMSDIPKKINVQLTATKGKKAPHEIHPLQVGPSLAEVLQAIKSASNKATMDAAKKLAATLTDDGDIERAMDAYKARVAELRAAAAPAKKPAADYIEAINAATSAETASLVLDEAKDVLQGAELDEVNKAFKMAWGM